MGISRAELGQLTLIAEGGFGKVYRTDHPLNGENGPSAYKEFTKDVGIQAAAVAAAVDFRNRRLLDDERALLDHYTAWPRELVEDDTGTVCGFLMPLVRDEFFCELIAVDTGQRSRKPREMQWLIARESTIQAAEVDLRELDGTERLFLVSQLAYIISWLHHKKWCFGDLSFKNVAFALDPPQIMLLDCDGAADLGNPGRVQGNTPFWEPPKKLAPPGALAGQPALQDEVTDSYKLGLAILRCLTPGNGASTSRNPDRFDHQLDSEGVTLVGDALSGERAGHPAAKELYSYLRKTTVPLVTIPEVVHATLITPLRLRGQDARIEWRLARATDITILVGDNFKAEIKYADYRKSYSFTPRESGPVSMRVSNAFGWVTVDLGELTLYELPEFNVDLNHLPRPKIPEVEAFSTEPLVTALIGDDGLEIPYPDIPEITPPESFDSILDLAPDVRITVPGPRIDDVVAETSNAIRNLILDEGERFVATLRQMNLGDGNG
jgi:hypothetical protein